MINTVVNDSEKTYQIIGFDKTAGQLLIKWDFDNSITPIDVPVIDGQYITGDALDIFIKGYFNVEYYDRLKNISVGVTNADVITALVSN